MNDRMIILNYTVVDPDESAASGALALYDDIPFDITIICVSVAPLEDDTGATLDINDDGTGVITGVDASDHNVPGRWDTPATGGTNSPVTIDAGSILSLDINSGAAANRFDVTIWALVGEVHGT